MARYVLDMITKPSQTSTWLTIFAVIFKLKAWIVTSVVAYRLQYCCVT